MGRRASGWHGQASTCLACSTAGFPNGKRRRADQNRECQRAALATLTRTQRNLLDRAAQLIKPGGRICYSTCSVQARENGLLVRTFLSQHPGFELGHEQLHLPSAEPPDHDGAYVAILHHRR